MYTQGPRQMHKGYGRTLLGKRYQQKVQEGKNKMSVINMIRSKLIQRILQLLKIKGLTKFDWQRKILFG